jgi:hypothetical protein
MQSIEESEKSKELSSDGKLSKWNKRGKRPKEIGDGTK